MDPFSKTLPDLFLAKNENSFSPRPHNDLDFSSKLPAASPLEHAWQEICDAAAHVSMREPLLRSHLRNVVLDRVSLMDTMAAILARKLSCEDMPQIELHAMMLDIFKEERLIPGQITVDLNAVKRRDPAGQNHLHVLLNMKGFHALQTYRISNALWRQGRHALAFSLSNKASLVFGVDIHPAARIGAGVMLDHGTGIVVGETTVIDDNVSILQSVTLGGTGKERGDRHPKIRSGVMIGAGAKILGNIEIGAMSKVAAGSVVLERVPSHCTVAGVPAKIVRHHLCDSFPAFEMNQSAE